MKSRFIFALALLFAFGAQASQEYTIDASHTEVGFSVKHMVVATVRGNFGEFSGKVFFNANDLSKTSVEGVVKVGTINTNNAKRDEHLRSADFFDAANHPEITLKTKSVSKKGDGFTAVSDLTIRGVTKEVTLDFTVTPEVKDPWGNVRVGLEATGMINRQDFGLTWNKALEGGGFVVSNEVKLVINAEFIKAS